MRPVQALRSRIRGTTGEESQHKKGAEEKPGLLDVLRKRNRELEVREGRKTLLKRVEGR